MWFKSHLSCILFLKNQATKSSIFEVHVSPYIKSTTANNIEKTNPVHLQTSLERVSPHALSSLQFLRRRCQDFPGISAASSSSRRARFPRKWYFRDEHCQKKRRWRGAVPWLVNDSLICWCFAWLWDEQQLYSDTTQRRHCGLLKLRKYCSWGYRRPVV